MECQQCGEREAVVHLTQIVDNEVSTVHLCERCAAERGIESEAEIEKSSLGILLSTVGKDVGAGLPEAETEGLGHLRCGDCGATLQDFRDIGRLGCPECYTMFARPLRELLRRLHGSTHHLGERYAAPGSPALRNTEAQVRDLREQLERAIETENFERAAEVRDQLRALE
jgi:protein arginine kinase activator